jgi:hypothetical protein
MARRQRISNERKNLTRLAGEFLVASRLTQRGYMVSLQWGTTIGYDILAFDKEGHVAFIEVKSSASHRGRWPLQKKYADPRKDNIPIDRRFVCCVDMWDAGKEPAVYVFPATVVAAALQFLYDGKFSKSPTYRLDLNGKPRGKAQDAKQPTAMEAMNLRKFVDAYDGLGVGCLR